MKILFFSNTFMNKTKNWGWNCLFLLLLSYQAQAERIALFYNTAYIQIAQDNLYAEGSNMKASLEAEGHDVLIFDGITAQAFKDALSTTDLLIIPELERRNLYADLDEAAKAVLEHYIKGGGGLIISGVVAPNEANSANALDLLNGLFQFSLKADAIALTGSSKMRNEDVSGTYFEQCPTIITNNNSISFLTEGFPIGTKKLYTDEATDNNTTVALLPYEDGEIVYLGWGWWNAAPVGAQDNGWLQLLEAAIDEVACSAPQAYCKNSFTVELEETGLALLNPYDLNNSSFSCSEIYDLEVYPNTFTCDDLGTQSVTFTLTDNLGRSVTTTTIVTVEDTQGACASAAMASIYGMIRTEYGEKVQDVAIAIQGTDNTPLYITEDDGHFAFDELLKEKNYTLVPQRSNDPINGVSTYDLVLISQHILQINTLDSPYKLLAADANNSGGITTADIVELRRLILYIQTDFMTNSSWRFIKEDFVFTDPLNPFQVTVPETAAIEALAKDEQVNFIGVKIGDVSGDATPNNEINNYSTGRNNEYVRLRAESASIHNGPSNIVNLSLTEAFSLAGFQMTLEYDAAQMKNVRIESELLEVNTLSSNIQNGLIHISCVQSAIIEAAANDVLLTLHFDGTLTGELKDAIKISQRYLNAEAYSDTKELYDVILEVPQLATNSIEITDFQLHQNHPNPFTNTTTIGFELETKGTTSFTIYDLTGKEIYTISHTYEAGYNEIALEAALLPGKGIFSYTLKTPTSALTKRMIKF